MNALPEKNGEIAKMIELGRQTREARPQDDNQSVVLTKIPNPKTPGLGLALMQSSLSEREEGYQTILKYSPAVGAIPAAIIAGMFGGGKIGLSVVSAWSERVSQACKARIPKERLFKQP